MATILGIPVMTLLEKAGLAILSAAGSYIVKKGTDAAQGGSDTSKIRNDIAGVSQGIKSLQSDVRALSDKLTDVLLQLRKDHLREFCVSIDSTHTSLLDAVATLFESIELAESPQRKQKILEADERVKKLLSNAIDVVPGWLDQIHAFMNERGGAGYLPIAAQRALDQSADFIAYYGKMRTLAMTHWVAVAEGIAILELAAEYPGVRFSEGRKTIVRQKAQILEQDQALRAAIGGACCDLAEAVLHSPEKAVAVWWKVWGGDSSPVRGQMYANADYAAVRQGLSAWYIQMRTSLADLDLSIGKKYAVYLLDKNNSSVYISGSQYGTDMVNDSRHSLNNWYIKPYEAGSNSFTVQYDGSGYMGKSYDGFFLDVRQIHGFAWCLMNMNQKPVKGSNPGGLFEFPRMTRQERLQEGMPLTDEELIEFGREFVSGPIDVPI
jgi:hypothetical protein